MPPATETVVLDRLLDIVQDPSTTQDTCRQTLRLVVRLAPTHIVTMKLDVMNVMAKLLKSQPILHTDIFGILKALVEHRPTDRTIVLEHFSNYISLV